MESKQVEVGAAALRQEIDLEAANAQFAIKCATCELPNVRESKNPIKTRLKKTLVFYLLTLIIQAEYKLISGRNVRMFGPESESQ